MPTFAQSGYPDYNIVYWLGVLATAVTAPAVLSRLHDALARAIAKPTIQEIFSHQGVRAISTTLADFARQVNEEIKI